MNRYHPVVPTVRSLFALSALALASLAAAALTVPVYAQTPTSNVYAFTNLNTLANLGTDVDSFAYGISGGVTVGYGTGRSTSGGSQEHALRWNADGTVSDLGAWVQNFTPGLGTSYATGISGSVIVGSHDHEAFRWNADGMVTNLSTLANLGSNAGSTAEGISGSVIVGHGGGSNTDNQDNALRWNANGTVTNLHSQIASSGINLGTNANSIAFGISSGITVGYGGGSNTGNQDNALRWNADGTVTNLHSQIASSGINLGTNASSVALGISGGVIVGDGYGSNTGKDFNGNSFPNALRWNANGTALNLQQFVPGSATSSRAKSIDASTGIIAGGTSNGAALWTPLNAGTGGANSLTVQNGAATTINQNFTQNAGLTTVNGTLDLKGNTLTFAGGTLNGAGTIAGNVVITGSGVLAPGNSPGTLNLSMGNFSMSGGTYSVDLAGLGAGQYDVLNVAAGSATFTGGTFSLNYLAGYTPTIGDFFSVVTTSGGVIGANTVSVPNGWAFTASGNNGRLSYLGSATAVPELGTLALAGVGVALSCLGLLRRKNDRV